MPATSPLIAGLELGGTKCIALLGTSPADVRDQRTIATTDPAATLGAIEAVLDSWTFDAIGIASFGPLQLDTGAPDYGAITATTKPGWSGTDLVRRLERRYGKPIGFQTDVNGAALAEARWGAAQGLATHAYITIGTGVGVGLIAGGRPVQGVAHGEAGHMRVPRAPGDTYAGWCRFHGDCVEGLISGPALAARFDRPGHELPEDGPQWDLFVHDLGGLLHNLVTVAAPERIAIGGGVIAKRAHLFPRIRARLAESLGGYGSLAGYAGELDQRLGPPGLDSMAGPLGALAVGLTAVGG
ncbi:ROK family protein [Sphingomonas psychrotolerans]|uniref:fructokinase n=1 Tax=Sphingomonas psychrotolerans TaxID=1327635 RepID=A0ABU3N5Q0_9SPHN|nr:ROK family protein [Sphingomonas psychrotolerans]MDT8758821.1 ROK family protein [Sphingomonas psychrotolerans]